MRDFPVQVTLAVSAIAKLLVYYEVTDPELHGLKKDP